MSDGNAATVPSPAGHRDRNTLVGGANIGNDQRIAAFGYIAKAKLATVVGRGGAPELRDRDLGTTEDNGVAGIGHFAGPALSTGWCREQ